ncbi:MAG: anion transporter [Planctomycetes bacterium]|nr:anion transporter [Planctomycetota bacterium]
MRILTSAVFFLTYALIAARRLRVLPIGRPAGALLGATLMVAIGALTPDESFRAIDHDTIVLLLGMMLLTAYLDLSGFFAWMADRMLRLARTPWRLLAGTALLAALLSAFLVNDPVCLFMTPMVVAACRRARLPMGPYLIALATSANIGSAATIVGNPQNMIIGSLSGTSFARFLAHAAGPVVAGLALNVALLWLYYRRSLPARFEISGRASVSVDRARLARVGVVAAGVIAGFFAGLHLGYTALGGGVAIMVMERKEPSEALRRVDWTLLVFFASLFIVVQAFARTGLFDDVWAWAAPRMRLSEPSGVAAFSALMAAGSNLVSNVPMVLLVGPHIDGLGAGGIGWVLLAFATTVAGNLTLVGSVANIIVAEAAKEDYALGFLEYLRFGVVSTVIVLATGVPIACVTAPWIRLLAGG